MNDHRQTRADAFDVWPLQQQAGAILDELLPLAQQQFDGLMQAVNRGKHEDLGACRLVIRNLGRAAGKAVGNTIIINQQLARHPHALRPTLAHELAHVLVERARQRNRVRHRRGHWAPHGTLWRRAALALGDSGERCHELELRPVRTVRRYLYRLPDGSERHLSAVRHHRLQRDPTGSYWWRGDSEPVRWHHLVGEVTNKTTE